MSEGHMSLMTVRYQHTSGYSLGLDNIPDETDLPRDQVTKPGGSLFWCFCFPWTASGQWTLLLNMLSILRKARLKDKEMRILMLWACLDWPETLCWPWKGTRQCRQNDHCQEDHERGCQQRQSDPWLHHQDHRLWWV